MKEQSDAEVKDVEQALKESAKIIEKQENRINDLKKKLKNAKMVSKQAMSMQSIDANSRASMASMGMSIEGTPREMISA